MANVYLDRSPIAGTGVFAARRLGVGEFILSFAEGRPAVVPCAAACVAAQDGGLYLQIGENRYILPRPPALYVNHSCDPNAGVRDCTELIALKPVEAGAEVAFDSSTSMATLMTCVCVCVQPAAGFSASIDLPLLPLQRALKVRRSRVLPGRKLSMPRVER